METTTIEQSIRKTTLTSNITSVLIAIIAAFGTGYGFYFNTKSALETHDKSIKTLENRVNENTEDINSIHVYKGVSSAEMKNLEKKVDKIDGKLDKLIESNR
jgi:peptidoglycan hydrolase CwlO-like protein